MVLMVIYRATLIRLCQTNARLKDDILGYIFCKTKFGNSSIVSKVILIWKWVKFLKKYAVWCFFTTKKAKTQHKHAEKFVYGADAVSELRTQEWFVRFCSGNFDVKDRPRSGRPVTEKIDEILQLVEQDRHVSCQKIANALRINHVTIWNHLKKIGYAKKLDV